MFVLLGRDPVAPLLVVMWTNLRHSLGATEPEALEESLDCALSMRDWALKLGKEDKLGAAEEAFDNESRTLASANLRELCHRAADAIEQTVREHDVDRIMLGRERMLALARELRGA